MTVETVTLLEELSANAWRSEIEQYLGGWRMRYSGGTSRRVNSVWPNHLNGSLSLQERLGIVEDFYRQKQQPARFQLCSAVQPENLPEILEKRGYRDSAHTQMQIANLEHLLEATRPPQQEYISTSHLDNTWFDTYTTTAGYSEESLPIRHGILSRIGPAANFVYLTIDDKPIATGLGVIERGWLGIFCVVTHAEYRRQGLATQIMHILAKWGLSMGAAQSYLQVMDNNPPALGIYSKLGYKYLYTYWYATQS